MNLPPDPDLIIAHAALLHAVNRLLDVADEVRDREVALKQALDRIQAAPLLSSRGQLGREAAHV